MAFKFGVVEATRVQKKVKILLSGPSNAGKTLSSLLIAKGLTQNGKVLIIDTETGRSSLHVGEPSLDGWTWKASYLSPEEADSNTLIEAIKFAENEGYDAVILDSITHEWEAIKQYQQDLGGRFTDWKKPKELHNKFVRAVLGARIHVIMTMRSKTEYVQDVSDKGRKTVRKLGMNPQGESNFIYEVDFHLIINEEHKARVDKTAQGLFTNPEFFFVTEQTGDTLYRFSEEGESAEDRQKRLFIARIRELASSKKGGVSLPNEEELMTYDLDKLTALGKELKESK